MKGRYIPNIRYTGFTGSWEKISLLELMTFSNGINAPKESYGIGRKMISVMDILDEGPIIYKKIRNSVQVEDKIEQKNKVENGDLVFVRSSETIDEVGIAKAYRQKDYALFSGFTIRGKRKNNFDAKFIELSLNNANRKQIERKAGGSTRFNVSQFLLNSIEILQPSIEEQEKVGKFFDELDSTIALHQQELNTLKQTKQGFLQKMFPKEGEAVPELRFPGFISEWEICKVSDVANMFNNLRVPVTATDRIKGSTPYYGANGIQDYVEGYTHDGEFVLIAEDGASDLINYPVKYVSGKVWVNNHAHVLSGKKGVIDNFFLATRINYMNIVPYLVGGGRTKLNGETLKKIPIKIPSFEEQIKIGKFFKQLDKIMALHQQELDALKQTKKAFLQKMFI